MSLLEDRLNAIENSITKVGAELRGEIDKLKDELAKSEISDEAIATLDRIDQKLADLDSVVDDAPPDAA